jgi:hypothetical protein
MGIGTAIRVATAICSPRCLCLVLSLWFPHTHPNPFTTPTHAQYWNVRPPLQCRSDPSNCSRKISALEGSYDDINITSTRCLVDIPLVPAAIITTHGKRKLSDFGPVPFKVVCLRSHLRLLPSSIFYLLYHPLVCSLPGDRCMEITVIP